MPNISTLIQDIYGILEGKTLGDPQVLAKFGPRLGEVLTSRFAAKQADREIKLRLSGIGKPLRQIWYEQKGYKGEELTGKVLFKFLYGDLLEAVVLVLAEASGHTVERLQEEVSVDGVPGHIDATIDGVLVDVKSCSPRSFEKFKSGALLAGNDPFGYIGQISGNAHALQLDAGFVAVDKVSGELCLTRVPRETIDEYDVRDRIAKVRQAVAGDTEPERCYSAEPDGASGNYKIPVGCSYCGYKLHCWRDTNDGAGLRSFIYANGIRYLSTVVLTPKVFEINNKIQQQEEVNSQ